MQKLDPSVLLPPLRLLAGYYMCNLSVYRTAHDGLESASTTAILDFHIVPVSFVFLHRPIQPWTPIFASTALSCSAFRLATNDCILSSDYNQSREDSRIQSLLPLPLHLTSRLASNP
jgi:hypothetical protein